MLLLVAVAWLGMSGGIGQWTDQVTPAQRVQLATQVVYGVFALLVLMAAFKWRRWQRVAEFGFVAGCVASASLATVVWGEASMLAALSAGVGTLIVAVAIIRMLRAGVHAPSKTRDMT